MSTSSALRAFQASRFAASRTMGQNARFSVAASLSAGKESTLGQDPQRRKDEIEHHKQEQLRAQKEGKAEWKDSLASDSESIVKADRGEVKATEEVIRELQEEGKRVGGKK